MRLLLDTHILLWWLNDDRRLKTDARSLIANADNQIFISHISLWEIQVKVMTGKLNADVSAILKQIFENNFKELPTSATHILKLSELPFHHQDPFDRMLIAQAMTESLALVSHDKNVSLYGDIVVLV